MPHIHISILLQEIDNGNDSKVVSLLDNNHFQEFQTLLKHEKETLAKLESLKLKKEENSDEARQLEQFRSRMEKSTSLLSKAFQKDLPKTVKKILELDSSVNPYYSDTNSPSLFYTAILNDKTKLIDAILESKAKIDISVKEVALQIEKCLEEAIKKNDKKLIVKILDALKNQNQSTAFMMGFGHGFLEREINQENPHEDILLLLMEMGAIPTQSMFDIASNKKMDQAIKKMLESKNAKINPYLDEFAKDSAFYSAVCYKNSKLINIILDSPAVIPESALPEIRRCIDRAIFHDNKNLVERILKKLSNQNLLEKFMKNYGFLVLKSAATNSIGPREDIAVLLMDMGANPFSSTGESVLDKIISQWFPYNATTGLAIGKIVIKHKQYSLSEKNFAAELARVMSYSNTKNYPVFTRLLLEKADKAGINFGETALQEVMIDAYKCASYVNLFDIVEKLVEKGANPYVISELIRKESALSYAISRRLYLAVDKLLASKAEVTTDIGLAIREAVDKLNTSLVAQLCQKGNPQVISSALAIWSKDKYSDDSILQRAVDAGNPRLVELLIKYGMNPFVYLTSLRTYIPNSEEIRKIVYASEMPKPEEAVPSNLVKLILNAAIDADYAFLAVLLDKLKINRKNGQNNSPYISTVELQDTLDKALRITIDAFHPNKTKRDTILLLKRFGANPLAELSWDNYGIKGIKPSYEGTTLDKVKSRYPAMLGLFEIKKSDTTNNNVNEVKEIGKDRSVHMLLDDIKHGKQKQVQAEVDSTSRKDNLAQYIHEETGETLLHFATDANMTDLIDSLIEKGANPFAVDYNLISPFYIALKNDNIDVLVKFMNAEKRHVEILDSHFSLLIENAIKLNKFDIAKRLVNYLISCYGELAVEDFLRTMPSLLSLVKEKENIELFKFFLDNGANPYEFFHRENQDLTNPKKPLFNFNLEESRDRKFAEVILSHDNFKLTESNLILVLRGLLSSPSNNHHYKANYCPELARIVMEKAKKQIPNFEKIMHTQAHLYEGPLYHNDETTVKMLMEFEVHPYLKGEKKQINALRLAIEKERFLITTEMLKYDDNKSLGLSECILLTLFQKKNDLAKTLCQKAEPEFLKFTLNDVVMSPYNRDTYLTALQRSVELDNRKGIVLLKQYGAIPFPVKKENRLRLPPKDYKCHNLIRNWMLDPTTNTSHLDADDLGLLMQDAAMLDDIELMKHFSSIASSRFANNETVQNGLSKALFYATKFNCKRVVGHLLDCDANPDFVVSNQGVNICARTLANQLGVKERKEIITLFDLQSTKSRKLDAQGRSFAQLQQFHQQAPVANPENCNDQQDLAPPSHHVRYSRFEEL